MDTPVLHGLYSVKDQYFKEFGNGYWVDNKNQHRPNYYLLKDRDDILWMIPMSTQAENYREKIKKVEEKRGAGNCIYYHIGIVAAQERVFLIGDMFPVSEEYINGEFTIGRIHYVVKNETLNKELRSKAMRYLRLVEQGVMKSRNDIIGIKRQLISRRENTSFIV